MTQHQDLCPKLDLSELKRGLPAITPDFGSTLTEASAICLTDRGHHPGVSLKVKGQLYCNLSAFLASGDRADVALLE